MSERDVTLPREIERVIREVLDTAGLEFVDGVSDVERELRAHFEDGIAAGASPEDLIARFGDPVIAGRRIAKSRPNAARRNRGERGGWWMSPREWWSEFRQAARRLRRAPGFTVIVVVTLALGVGANTAIFAVLDAVLFEELPYPNSDRLVKLYEGSADDTSINLEFLRAPVLAELRTWDEVFEKVGGIYTYREIGADLTDGDVPQRVTVSRVSAGYFETLGIIPARGRTFLEDESYGPGEATSSTIPIARVAVISHGLWLNTYGGDADIVGRVVQLDGAGFEVVGVMPRGFSNPFGSRADLWVPQDLRFGGSNNYGNFYMSGVARLRDGITIEAARERLAVLQSGFEEVEPDVEGDMPRMFPLQDDLVGSTRRAMLWILAVAAGLVLLTACVNVANLLFARGLEQDRHLALRSALGSGRARLIAGILTEHSLLAVGGGVVGLAMGWMGMKVLVRLAPDALPMIVEPQLGGSVFGFASVVTVGALLAFGLAPAIRLSRASPAEVLRSGDRSATVGRAAKRLRDLLVVVQVAAALMLVAGAGLLTRSFNTLLDVPLGVEAEGVLTFEVHLPDARYASGADRQTFHERLQDRVSSLPSVESVGATSWLPVNGTYHSWMLYWDPENPDRSNNDAWVGTDVRIVAGDYFGSMGIDVIKGDQLDGVDLDAEPVVWINQEIVDEVFHGAEALGQQIFVAGADRRIMGVVEDVPFDPRGEVSKKSYVPHAQYADNRNWAMIQTVRARGDLSSLLEQVRQELRSLDPKLVLYRPQAFNDVLATVRAQDRFATVLMGLFASLALVLSVVGIYGVLAGTVASRTREIGIRMALGADAREVRGMVMRHAAGVTIPGVLLGLLGAWFGSRWISALLFDVGAVDLVAYGGAVVIFVGVGMFSGWIPARRATRVDTVQAIAAE